MPSRSQSDEAYVIDLCHEVLGMRALRQHGFDSLRGDARPGKQGVKLPVDAYYSDRQLVVEYCERQHSEPIPIMDQRMTISGVDRGTQRAIYDQRRRDVLPTHGIELVELSYDDFAHDKNKYLCRRRAEDLAVVRQALAKWIVGGMQMDALEALMTRRSVRAYTDETVSDDQVRKILAAGMQAPSAGNQQPWHFVVLRQREHLAGLAGVLEFGKMLGQAPLGIVVCADVGREQQADYWVQDCAAATENILLACHALGLGAVWIGVYPRSERVTALRQLLSLPATVTPLCAIAIGRPAEHPAPVDRFRPDRIHAEQW